MSELTIAILAGLGGMFGWGFSDFFAAKAIKQTKLSELQANLMLWTITAILLWIIVILDGFTIPPLSIEIIFQLLFFAALNMLAYIFFFKALHIGNLSTISTIFSTYAVGATVISIIIFNESVSSFRLFALLTIFLGVVGVSIQDSSKLTIIKGLPQILIAVLLFSIFFPFWDQFLSTNNTSGLFWVALVDSLVAILFFFYTKSKEKPKLKFSKKYTLIGFAGAANVVAVAATSWGFATTTLTSIIVVVSSAVPLVAALLGVKYLKEKLIPLQYLGIGLILFGVVLLTFS